MTPMFTTDGVQISLGQVLVTITRRSPFYGTVTVTRLDLKKRSFLARCSKGCEREYSRIGCYDGGNVFATTKAAVESIEHEQAIELNHTKRDLAYAKNDIKNSTKRLKDVTARLKAQQATHKTLIASVRKALKK